MSEPGISGPSTPAALVALSPEERLEFFKGLETTSAEIAACVIYTVINDVRPEVAIPYYGRLAHLVGGANPLHVYLLASRFVNTAKAPKERLHIHQHMVTVLADLLNASGYVRAYVQHDAGLLFVGTLSRRTAVTGDDELRADDLVVYRTRDVLPKQRSTNGRWPEVKVLRVEIAAQTLPETLGM